MRELSELVDVQHRAWPELSRMFEAGPLDVRVLPPDPEHPGRCLLRVQVGAGSFLGAVALESSGILVDGGWLRVHGGGCADLPGLDRVNGMTGEIGDVRPARLVVAHDVIGGVFALNGPETEALGWPGAPGEMVYFAPDSLEWEPLGTGCSGWWERLLAGHLTEFYEGLRWPGWRAETANLPPSTGVTVYPFLWSAEAQSDLAATTRTPAPVAELVGANLEFCSSLGLPAPGPLGSF
ncbi:DUF2625 domain-containing protein [Nocardiopsis exhalans]|uniref:DUF2625 domain-containing protein n=1 Tax=Nocardiopsis exhalans TaxID=163604 RepID=A0ABY5DGC7_9ACTN|nr:DUF2625 family protein [Nocardiopsis exhalans]USY22040.1 DUF2625 domain-containing protein [Nocardiopsis exhalans]